MRGLEQIPLHTPGAGALASGIYMDKVHTVASDTFLLCATPPQIYHIIK